MRLAVAALLFAAYALPLFWPPTTAPLRADAGLLERLYPGVPALWTGLRLLSLAASLALLAGFLTREPFLACAAAAAPAANRTLRLAALFVAAALLVVAPFAGGFGAGHGACVLPWD